MIWTWFAVSISYDDNYLLNVVAYRNKVSNQLTLPLFFLTFINVSLFGLCVKTLVLYIQGHKEFIAQLQNGCLCRQHQPIVLIEVGSTSSSDAWGIPKRQMPMELSNFCPYPHVCILVLILNLTLCQICHQREADKYYTYLPMHKIGIS